MLPANFDWQDQQIKDFFRLRKQQDEQVTPAFASVWESVRLHSRPFPRRRPTVQLALVIVVGMIMTSAIVFLTLRPAPEASKSVESSLSQWRSPTDFLLTSSKGKFFQSVPRIGKPYFELQLTQTQNMEEL